jgi:hypothetical protein
MKSGCEPRECEEAWVRYVYMDTREAVSSPGAPLRPSMDPCLQGGRGGQPCQPDDRLLNNLNKIYVF